MQGIALGSLWENDYRKSFNSKPLDECLKPEIFHSLKEAQVVIGLWRDHDSRVRPHASLTHWTIGHLRPRRRPPPVHGDHHAAAPN
jgi:hypothetical protein